MFYLGTITGASGAYYNNQTGASGIGTFSIPPSTRALYLVPSASGTTFLLSAATGVTGFISAANGAQLSGPGVINGPFRPVAGTNFQNVTVGIYNSAGGFVSVRVFAAPPSS